MEEIRPDIFPKVPGMALGSGSDSTIIISGSRIAGIMSKKKLTPEERIQLIEKYTESKNAKLAEQFRKEEEAYFEGCSNRQPLTPPVQSRLYGEMLAERIIIAVFSVAGAIILYFITH